MARNANDSNGLMRTPGLAMKKITIDAGALFIVLLTLASCRLEREQAIEAEFDRAPLSYTMASPDHQDFLYGRITMEDGAIYEGRLRFGGTEEAFWGDYFNGSKDENPWIEHLSPERLKDRRSIRIFGFEIADWERKINFGRPFMTRFGDIARIEARRRNIWVTLRSGTVIELDRYASDDLADGVRVWDTRHGVQDFDEWGIRLIEFLPTAQLENAPNRLHGTVQTRHGEFTGFVQWNREEGVATDELHGHSADGELGIPFHTIRSIARNSSDGSLVTLLDGSELVLSGTREVSQDNRGLYIDDQRYGRVLINWEAFARVDFSPSDNGPGFDDFPPGVPLTGTVTTRAGNRLTGRLVYDLDESETTETLDAPSDGVNYTIPFGLIASIVPPQSAQPARVLLHSGEKLQLERSGDLGEANAGMLIFVDGRVRPEYVAWVEVERIDFDRPQAMYPRLDTR